MVYSVSSFFSFKHNGHLKFFTSSKTGLKSSTSECRLESSSWGSSLISVLISTVAFSSGGSLFTIKCSTGCTGLEFFCLVLSLDFLLCSFFLSLLFFDFFLDFFFLLLCPETLPVFFGLPRFRFTILADAISHPSFGSTLILILFGFEDLESLSLGDSLIVTIGAKTSAWNLQMKMIHDCD